MIDMEKFPALKSLNRFIITFFFVLGVTFNMVAPFSIVNADVLYTTSENSSNPVYTGFSVYEVSTGNTYFLKYKSRTNNPINCFMVFSNNNYANGRCVFISDTSNQVQYNLTTTNDNSNFVGGYTTTLQYSSTYSVYYRVAGDYASSRHRFNNPSGTTAYLVNQNLNSMSDEQILAFCLENYQSPIDYGEIKDISYSTNIVGSGTTTGDANIDTISWYPYWDSNDNISTTWNMEIQVVPGTWQGGTNTDIFSQSYQDFIINESGAMDIYRGTYLNGSYSISWGEVKNKLQILSWADLFQYFDGEYWNKKGWVYRARYNDPDNNFWSPWQTIYTVTSSAGEGVENYIDPSDGTGLSDFYNNAVNSYNTTSVVNNNNNVTYYYVNTPIDTNPSSDDSTQYLKEIRDTIIQIRRMIAVDHNADNTPNNDNDPWHGNPAAELYDFEDSSINDFNDAISDLPTSDLVTGNKFLAASTWVRTQYEAIVSNTPIEAVIVFSLLLGFGLLLIGKLR